MIPDANKQFELSCSSIKGTADHFIYTGKYFHYSYGQPYVIAKEFIELQLE